MKELGREGTEAIKSITAETQVLLNLLGSLGDRFGPTLQKFQDLRSKGQYRLENTTPGTDEFRRGANTVAVAQRNIQEINREITDAVRLANGLRTISEEVRALNTYNVTQNKKSFLKQQAEDAQALKTALQGMEFGGSNPIRHRP